MVIKVIPRVELMSSHIVSSDFARRHFKINVTEFDWQEPMGQTRLDHLKTAVRAIRFRSESPKSIRKIALLTRFNRRISAKALRAGIWQWLVAHVCEGKWSAVIDNPCQRRVFSCWLCNFFFPGTFSHVCPSKYGSSKNSRTPRKICNNEDRLCKIYENSTY